MSSDDNDMDKDDPVYFTPRRSFVQEARMNDFYTSNRLSCGDWCLECYAIVTHVLFSLFILVLSMAVFWGFREYTYVFEYCRSWLGGMYHDLYNLHWQ